MLRQVSISHFLLKARKIASGRLLYYKKRNVAQIRRIWFVWKRKFSFKKSPYIFHCFIIHNINYEYIINILMNIIINIFFFNSFIEMQRDGFKRNINFDFYTQKVSIKIRIFYFKNCSLELLITIYLFFHRRH